MNDAENEIGSELVQAARDVLAGRLPVLEMETVLARSTVFAQRPATPGVGHGPDRPVPDGRSRDGTA